MKLRQLVDALEQIAPTKHAESWDNAGLLVGDPEQSVTRAMLTIDYTPEVACEAAGEKCDAIVAYHPPIFAALKRVTSGGASAAIFDAIRRGVAIYSPHTALDVADGGTNDVLADVLGMIDRSPLKMGETKSTQYKLVTFVPAEQLDKVSEALFAAGAGRIGNYSSCSFRTKGTGTFFGDAGTNPAIGSAGRLERADEIRLETVVPIAKIESILRALRESHPYEEPAFDLLQLAAAPESIGIGRIGKLPGEATADMLINRIKRELDIPHVLVAGDPTRLVRRAAVCAGSCGDLLEAVIAQKADFYLTGEMRHHDALKAAARGVTVVCALHSNTERIALKRLRERLAKSLPDLPCLLSQKDRDPFAIH
ncbi:Nif3-like dinuclear metal center hexameric protein [soil metagenome]